MSDFGFTPADFRRAGLELAIEELMVEEVPPWDEAFLIREQLEAELAQLGGQRE